MALTLPTATRNASCDAEVDLVDAGAGAGKLKIYDGAALLVTVALNDPAFENAGTAAAGQARAIGGDGINPIAAGNPLDDTASGAGTADVYSVTDSNDVVRWSGTVSVGGGGGDLIIDNTSIAVGQVVTVTGWTHTVPAS